MKTGPELEKWRFKWGMSRREFAEFATIKEERVAAIERNAVILPPVADIAMRDMDRKLRDIIAELHFTGSPQKRAALALRELQRRRRELIGPTKLLLTFCAIGRSLKTRRPPRVRAERRAVGMANPSRPKGET